MATPREIRKNRTLIYFIEAAQKIIEDEGIEKVTIRKVADLAGYNSATLYNYFKDLNHLLLFASLKYLNEYNEDVKAHTKQGMTAREKLVVMWESFCKLAFEHPSIYCLMFFDKHSVNLSNITEQYYGLFPEEKSTPIGELPEKEEYLSLSHRNRLALEKIYDEEKLDPQNIDLVNELMILAFNSMLSSCVDNPTDELRAGCSKRMMEYVRFLLSLD